MNIDKQQLNIACPECGKVFQETIGNIKKEMKAFCYSCGTFVGVDEGYLKRAIDGIMGDLNIG